MIDLSSEVNGRLSYLSIDVNNIVSFNEHLLANEHDEMMNQIEDLKLKYVAQMVCLCY
jgi:hypothetical protein